MRSRRRPKIVHVFRSLKFQNIIRLPKPALRFWPVRLALFGSYRYRWLYLIHSMSLRTKKRPNFLNDMLKFESPVKWQLSDAKITLAVSHGPLKSKNSLKFTVWTNQWFLVIKKENVWVENTWWLKWKRTKRAYRVTWVKSHCIWSRKNTAQRSNLIGARNEILI